MKTRYFFYFLQRFDENQIRILMILKYKPILIKMDRKICRKITNFRNDFFFKKNLDWAGLDPLILSWAELVWPSEKWRTLYCSCKIVEQPRTTKKKKLTWQWWRCWCWLWQAVAVLRKNGAEDGWFQTVVLLRFSLCFPVFSSSPCFCSPASTFLLRSLTMVELLLMAVLLALTVADWGAEGGWWFFFLYFPCPLFLPSLLFFLLFSILFRFLLCFCWWWSCCRQWL